MDYAQSRLQARFGDRPDDSLWLNLEAVAQPDRILEIARASGLKRWVSGIASHPGQQEIELALRERWRECVTEVAAWMPEGWQAALLWTRGLVDLPALCYLARGEAPLRWMDSDPVLQVYARADAASRAAMLRKDFRELTGAPFAAADAAVLPAGSGPARICQAWLDEWRRRWPRRNDTASLEALARLFHAAVQQATTPGHPELMHKLRRLFRSSVLHPVVAFVYIAFAALDLQRLRAGLLKAALVHEGILAS